MWPQDYQVTDEDRDSTGALLGYVSHVRQFQYKYLVKSLYACLV